MRVQNAITGDLLEVPQPNELGESCVLLNGVEIFQVLYSDDSGGSVTLGDGRRFAAGSEFADFLISQIAPQRQCQVAVVTATSVEKKGAGDDREENPL